MLKAKQTKNTSLIYETRFEKHHALSSIFLKNQVNTILLSRRVEFKHVFLK